jgi:hypothetical protein
MEDKCTCEQMSDNDAHPCPYALDVNDEYELPEDQWTLCTCCPECKYQCAMDI